MDERVGSLLPALAVLLSGELRMSGRSTMVVDTRQLCQGAVMLTKEALKISRGGGPGDDDGNPGAVGLASGTPDERRTATYGFSSPAGPGQSALPRQLGRRMLPGVTAEAEQDRLRERFLIPACARFTGDPSDGLLPAARRQYTLGHDMPGDGTHRSSSRPSSRQRRLGHVGSGL